MKDNETCRELRLLAIPLALMLIFVTGGYSLAASRINPVPEQEALEIGLKPTFMATRS